MLSGRIRFETAFGVLLAASLVLRLAYAPSVPLTSDELMHWQWARHLDLGYPEHPPMIAWLIALFTGLLGDHAVVVRLVPVLAVTTMFAAGFRLSREMFGARAAFFGVVPMMLTPLFNIGGLLANTDGLLACFWMLTVFSVKRAVLDGRRGAWWFVGLFTGLTMLSKLPGIFLVIATVLFLIGSTEGRRRLRSYEPYAAWLLAIALFSPVVVWNARHGWFTISMRVGHQATGGFTLKYLAELVGAQMLILTPFLFVWVVWGLYRSLAAARRDTRFLLLGVYMAVPFLFYTGYSVFARAGIHWPAIGYVTGFLAAGALTAASTRRPSRGRLLAAAAAPAALLTAAVLFVALFPGSVSRGWHYAGRPEKVSATQLDNIFDWGRLGAEIERDWQSLADPRFLMVRQGYGLAGLVAFYTPGQPPVFLWELQGRNGASYDMWKSEAELIGADAVIVEDEPSEAWFRELECCFDRLYEPRRVEIVRNGRAIREFYLVRAEGFSGFPRRLMPQ